MTDIDNPQEREAEEIERLLSIAGFLSEGEITVNQQPVRKGVNESETLINIHRIRPSWRVYGLESGRPLAIDEDDLQTTAGDLRKAIGFISQRLWTPNASLPPKLGVYVTDLKKFISNVERVGNYQLPT